MLLVLPFYNGDRALAEKWAAWSNELGPYPNHDMLIVRDHRAEPIPALGQTFRTVTELVVTDDRWDKWPQSPNNMFAKAARHIEYLVKKPWFWAEPDSWPLGELWLDKIENGYIEALKAGKHFLGAKVDVNGVPVHMSGIGVYPGILTEYAGEALLADDVAWDVAASRQIVPKMHESKLICHSWDRELDAKLKDRKARFENYQAVVREVFVPHPEGVIYHADKTGSLPDLLRQARGFKTENVVERGGVVKPIDPKKPWSITTRISEKATSQVQKPTDKQLALSELIEKLTTHFTDPLAKGRIIKKLKSYPVIK